jgi:hypothetical protein
MPVRVVPAGNILVGTFEDFHDPDFCGIFSLCGLESEGDQNKQ